ITNTDYIAVWAICRPLITGIAMSILKLFKKVWTFQLVTELEIYKNLGCFPSSNRKIKLEAIKEHYEVYPVKTMCRMLDVNTGTFYNHLN
ncbi:MAG: hypothetical protein RBR50_08450, partial [Candidatus Izemoplasmatales bacterium]|nr:hypothetical protein [Candidatus Izemoplasmatales bacterium]